MFFQKGENKNGGVLILVRYDLQVSRIDCKLPNVCIIEIRGDELLRLVGVSGVARGAAIGQLPKNSKVIAQGFF